MDEEVRVTVKAPDSVINPDSMSQNESMQPKQTTDDMAGNQREARETDQYDESDDDDENAIDEFVINLATSSFWRKVRIRHIISPTQKKTPGYTCNLRNTNHILCSIFYLC